MKLDMQLGFVIILAGVAALGWWGGYILSLAGQPIAGLLIGVIALGVTVITIAELRDFIWGIQTQIRIRSQIRSRRNQDQNDGPA